MIKRAIRSAINGKLTANTQPRIDAHGQFIVYKSQAVNLDNSIMDSNDVSDIYLYHIKSNLNRRVSWQIDGNETLNSSHNPDLSTEGQVVYDKSDQFEQHHIYGYNFGSELQDTVKLSMSADNDDLWVDNYKPAISSNGN
ncbi:MAG: hypothetical protein KZQ83_01070 [gamma proteobacterium symbiont of Taylorina sp.]|nr:hypothetical protein [gamma proteobacterium symbiont of Taylorina sp.]